MNKSQKKQQEGSNPAQIQLEEENQKEQEVPGGPTRSVILYSSLVFWLSFSCFLFFFANLIDGKMRNKEGNVYLSSITLGLSLLMGFVYLFAIVFMHTNFKFM